ncbi:PQ loop repeat-domain-containing protein [Lophiotrema nucula]|uniref:PQ loop repeat-domain-containing protein n=1 Tax=Lophiotrema nucula TaxID=690887 RepID=A0A6A5ZWA7_9PLEO|nr:PQ loop repeat-domain-containing protein [Lophiotrema nucula]
MPPFLSPLRVAQPSLPAYCEPENDFLYHFSAAFHTCVPTNLSFISSLLGTFSIVSWLFAQLPQIYKNHQLKSTSGLSIFFLAEWLLGDVSNLLGSLLTNQALWQVIIAGYYVSVDCALVGQWIWYELLKHGRPLRPAWSPLPSSDRKPDQRGPTGTQDVFEGLSVESIASPPATPNQSTPDTDKKDTPPGSSGRNIPHRSNPMGAFRIPNFAQSPSSTKEASSMGTTPTLGTTPNRTVRRLANSSSPMPSPKTVLYISLILAVLSNSSTATPVSPFAPVPYHAFHITARATTSEASSSASEIAGKVLSWMSTFLYLGSRLPQLYKNYVRKSTAGLSPALFAAAFFGNLFYSTSLLTNPCAWNTYEPGEGAGWVGPEGSDQADWVLRATPFFLGAAGVLVMDAAVGFQFLYFGDGADRGRPTTRDDEVIVVLNDHGVRKWRRWRWRRVSGWMRGWVPSVSVAGTPNVSRASTPADTPRSVSPNPGASPRPSPDRRIGSSSGRGALDEARALLGTSPRSYGGTSPSSSLH